MSTHSAPPGSSTSADNPEVSQAAFDCQVTDITLAGFWLLVDGIEYFVPFADYPIFRKASIEQVFAMQRLSPGQFRWEELDADIELDALEHPEHFPLAWTD